MNYTIDPTAGAGEVQPPQAVFTDFVPPAEEDEALRLVRAILARGKPEPEAPERGTPERPAVPDLPEQSAPGAAHGQPLNAGPEPEPERATPAEPCAVVTLPVKQTTERTYTVSGVSDRDVLNRVPGILDSAVLDTAPDAPEGEAPGTAPNVPAREAPGAAHSQPLNAAPEPEPEEEATEAAHGQPLNAAPEPEAAAAVEPTKPAAPAEATAKPGTAFAQPVEQTAGDSCTAPGLPESKAAEAAPGVPEKEAPRADHGQPLNAGPKPEAERAPDTALHEPEPAAPAESGTAFALPVEQAAGSSCTAPELPEGEAPDTSPNMPEKEAPGAAHGQPLNTASEPEAERAPGTALHEPELAAPAESGTAFALPVEQAAGSSCTAPELPEGEAPDAAPGVPEKEAPGADHSQPLNAGPEPEAERASGTALHEPEAAAAVEPTEPAAPAEAAAKPGTAFALPVEQTAERTYTVPGVLDSADQNTVPDMSEGEAPDTSPNMPEKEAPGVAHGQPLNTASEPEAERAPDTALHEPELAAPAESGTAFALPVEQAAEHAYTVPGVLDSAGQNTVPDMSEGEAPDTSPNMPEKEAPGAAHGQPLNAGPAPEPERAPGTALHEPEPAAPAESDAPAGLAAGLAATVQPVHGKLAVLSPLRSWVQELSGVYIALVSALVAGLVTLLKAYGYVWYQGFFSYYGLHCADVGHTLDSGFSMLLFQMVLGLLFYFSLCLFWQGLALFSPEPPQTVLGVFPLEDDPPRRLGVLAALIGAVVNGVCWYIFAGSVLPFLPSLLPLLVLVGLSWLGTLIAYSIVMLLQKRPDKLPALWNWFRNGVAHLWRVLPTLGRWLWRSLSALVCWLAKSLAALLRWLWHSLAALLHWLGHSLTAPRRWLAGKLPRAAAWYQAHLVPLGKRFAAWLGRCRGAVCSGCRSLWARLRQKAGAVYARRGQRAPAEKRGGFRLPMDVLAGGLAALLGLVLLGGLAYSQGRMTAHNKRAYLIIQKPEAAYAVIEQGDAFYWALGATPDAETGTLVLDRAARHAFALEDVLAYEQEFDTVTFAP